MSAGTTAALPKIIIAGKQLDVQELARPFTKELFAANDISDIWNVIDSTEASLILIDYAVPRDQIASFLQAHSKSIDIPVVILGHENDAGIAEYFTRLGAYDYLLGRAEYNRLGQIVDQIIKANLPTDTDSDNDTNIDIDTDDFFPQDCLSPVSIVGRSKATRQMLKMLNLVAKSSCNPVLVVGETGTGKELAARAVHILRHGTETEFVAVNCAALTANLLESELFGHVKGAFTGADREKTGLLQFAGTGSVFLDEISEMPLELQPKLLRVLQEKTFRKVGGIEDIHCNATIIVSSNRNLHAEAQGNRFRRDLYYRLAVCPVTIAPLRSPDRRNDIPILADYFLRTSNICPEKRGKITSLTKLALEALLKHDWPGNVRELRNVIDRAILLETTNKIGLSSLVINPDTALDAPAGLTSVGPGDFSLQRAERELIARALKETDWQKTRAAALLGITRATLYAKVKQYDIHQPSAQSSNSNADASPQPHESIVTG